MKDRIVCHDDWKTPEKLYRELDQEFKFNFDPCPLYSDFDGLSIEWKERNYINPPYSRKLKEAFIRKAKFESEKGKLCVLLLPVSTSTKIFHELIWDTSANCFYKNVQIRFIKGRVTFGIDTHGTLGKNHNGQHDSMLVIFDGRKLK